MVSFKILNMEFPYSSNTTRGGRGSGSYIFQILVDAAHAAGTPRRYFYLLPLFFFARLFFTPPPRFAPPPPPPPRPASC
jgi:hypothetical protein